MTWLKRLNYAWDKQCAKQDMAFRAMESSSRLTADNLNNTKPSANNNVREKTFSAQEFLKTERNTKLAVEKPPAWNCSRKLSTKSSSRIDKDWKTTTQMSSTCLKRGGPDE